MVPLGLIKGPREQNVAAVTTVYIMIITMTKFILIPFKFTILTEHTNNTQFLSISF